MFPYLLDILCKAKVWPNANADKIDTFECDFEQWQVDNVIPLKMLQRFIEKMRSDFYCAVRLLNTFLFEIV